MLNMMIKGDSVLVSCVPLAAWRKEAGD